MVCGIDSVSLAVEILLAYYNCSFSKKQTAKDRSTPLYVRRANVCILRTARVLVLYDLCNRKTFIELRTTYEYSVDESSC